MVSVVGNRPVISNEVVQHATVLVVISVLLDVEPDAGIVGQTNKKNPDRLSTTKCFMAITP